MITVCGSGGDSGFSQGRCLTEAVFNTAFSVCIDSVNPLNFFVGDITSVRYVNTATDTVSLIAGSKREGWGDGIGAAAMFCVVYDLLCTSDGKRIYAVDYHSNRIRSIDLKTQAVTTIAGDGKSVSWNGFGVQSSIHRPRKFVFGRSASDEPESVLYITSEGGIRRFDLTTQELTTCKVQKSDTRIFTPWAIDAVPSGHLIVSCDFTSCIYLFDPLTGKLDLLAGSPGRDGAASGYADGAGGAVRFDSPLGLAVVESERCAYISDAGQNRRIRRMTLPQSLFS